MRIVGVKTDVAATKGSAELNHHKQKELKEVRHGATTNGRGRSEEGESRNNEDVNGGRCVELVPSQGAVQRQHQQPQGPVVQWERFLPVRSLKVLLVEDDDSTRHVVSALLRNCSYEVTAVANGVEAWKVLIDLNKQIDLVLTEVVMPFLSGIGLLSKIMSHLPRKNIPVIMMSSDDSMGIVFNCLSKGAADFLVKPIRKNELKNLWQHVWRKCHSSSGSESESVIHTRKSLKARRNDDSDDSDSSEEDDDTSMGLTPNGSDDGSGTQSSWSKREVEVNDSQSKSLWNQLTNPPDSTCAQVIHATPKTSNNYSLDKISTRGHDRKDDKLDAVAMGKDLEIGVPRSSGVQIAYANGNRRGKFGESISKELDVNVERLDKARIESSNAIVSTHKETIAQANDLIKNINVQEKAFFNTNGSPTLELSLKRPRDMEDTETSNQGRSVLRQSGLSAFSRYNTTSNTNQAPTGNVGSCSPLDISSEAAKPENIKSNANGIPNQRSNGSSNNDDMGSTTNNAFTKPPALADDKPLPNTSTINVHRDSAIQPLVPCTDTVKTATTQQQIQVRHHHHHYHHHHHHVRKSQQQQMTNHDDGSLRNPISNVLTEAAEGNAANYGSTSGSNNKSNGEKGQKGNSYGAKAEGDNMGSDNGVAQKCAAGDGSGSGSGSGRGSGVDQDRIAQREAALNKFRQKRKERCFEKKVRYQSRKKLAEQRPRVRGQFVRQGQSGNTNYDAES